MAKYIISSSTYDDGVFGNTIISKVLHDINGNPRYIVRYNFFNSDYDKALNAAHEFGFTKCQKVGFKFYFICSTYGGFDEVHRRVLKARVLIANT